MARSRLPLAPVVLAVTLISPGLASAWGNSGHLLVADLAYRQLGATERAKAIGILKAAFDNSDGQGLANFKKDLTRGLSSTATPADRDRYIFMKAATWPDIIRDEDHPCNEEFHKSSWHFINLPYVPPGDTIPVPLEPVLTPAGQEPRDIISAIRLCMADVKAEGTTTRVRAARLCFLLHMIGDLHQPLHAVAMFSNNKLKQGDQGGNKMLVLHFGEAKSLHAIFDGLFGEDTRLKTIKALGDTIVSDPTLSRSALGTNLAQTDMMDWARESVADAIKWAYLKGEIQAFRGMTSREFTKANLDLDLLKALPDDYVTNVLDAADNRVALAGYRLADALGKILE